MRLTPILALALALGSAGCVYIPLSKIPSLDVTSLASGTLTVKIKPTVTDGGYRTQAIVNPWTRANIQLVVLDVYKLEGSTEKAVLQTVENTTSLPHQALAESARFRVHVQEPRPQHHLPHPRPCLLRQ